MSTHEGGQVGASLWQDPFQVRYSFEVYQAADNAFERCVYTISNKDDEGKILSVTTTNVIIEIFSKEIIQPLQAIPHVLSQIQSTEEERPIDEDLVSQVQKIASRVLSFSPAPQAEPAFLSKFRPDLRKRTLNLFRSHFPKSFNALATFFLRTRGDKEEGIVGRMLGLYPGSLCDAIGCECFRRLDEIDIPRTLQYQQKIYGFLSEIEKARISSSIFGGGTI